VVKINKPARLETPYGKLMWVPSVQLPVDQYGGPGLHAVLSASCSVSQAEGCWHSTYLNRGLGSTVRFNSTSAGQGSQQGVPSFEFRVSSFEFRVSRLRST